MLAAVFFSSALKAQTEHAKSSLKVLFVGYDPAKPLPKAERLYPGLMDKEGFSDEYPVRMPAFKSLLSQYFSAVKTIDCRDWQPADSELYDVTIFDFTTKPLEEMKAEKKENGEIEYIQARYLPDDFSKPVVFIANTAGEMGARIGLKLDWYCLCLDADAHHLNTNHPIFKGPLEKVEPTMENKKTPDGIYNYSKGAQVPKELPMWRVQKKGYLDGTGFRTGLVSRGNRFTESPDTEMISSGVCLKDVGAVALGRHGNFFLWGFSASPAHMTDEAKKVFVNVVAYMKQFNGKKPIARKYNDRMATTDDVSEIINTASKEGYENFVARIKLLIEKDVKEAKRLNDKKAAGEKLTSSEEESLFYTEQRSHKIDSWEVYLKRKMGKLADKFGTDADAFKKYITDNFDYIYCDPNGFRDFSIDEDAKQIGVSNHSLKLLDTCINMLKKDDRAELALRVLKKYTGENFATAKEWSKWFSKNKSKLFFSETNGYRFMINTYN